MFYSNAHLIISLNMSDDEYDEFGNLIGVSDNDSEVSDDEEVSQALIPHSERDNVVVSIPETAPGGRQQPVLVPQQERTAIETQVETPSYQYLINTLIATPERQRLVALVGQMGNGKSLIMTMMTGSVLKSKLEKQRKMTLSTPVSTVLLPTMDSQSMVVTVIDTPGHPDFKADILAVFSAGCHVTVVIDAVEGLSAHDKWIIDQALRLKLEISIIISKLDRLILDLRLPVNDCFAKLQYMVEEVRAYISTNEYNNGSVAPEVTDIVFSSAKYNFMFTITSFSRQYRRGKGGVGELALRLWSGWYYNQGKITTKEGTPLFISFILLPLYKIFTNTLVHDPGSDSQLPKMLWDDFGITLTKAQLRQEPQDLLKLILKEVFIGVNPYVDVLARASPSQIDHNRIIRVVDDVALVMLATPLGEGSSVYVVGNNYEDFRRETVGEITLPGGIPLQHVPAGSMVLVKGISTIIAKSGYIFCTRPDEALHSIDYTVGLVFKVAIEPRDLVDLARMARRAQQVTRQYLALEIKVESLGEYTVYAPGELYLDCMLHSIRGDDYDLQIKVTLPLVRFAETVESLSVAKIDTKTSHNLISIVAEPMEDAKLSRAISEGRFQLLPNQPVKQTAKILRNEYGWDSLAARSLWCFGPKDHQLPSLLVDDCLDATTDKLSLYSGKDAIVLGFQWCVSEGPLCDEPIRNTKFRILDAAILTQQIYRSTSVLVPLARQACGAGFMLATPRLMEPIYRLDVTYSAANGTGHQIKKTVTKLVQARRGDFSFGEDIPGTPLSRLVGFVPVIDAMGLESDIRVRTQGQAMCYLTFERYEKVPGNPLDESQVLEPFQPALEQVMARDFVMKTRARKGLAGQPKVETFVDPDVCDHLQTQGLI